MRTPEGETFLGHPYVTHMRCWIGRAMGLKRLPQSSTIAKKGDKDLSIR
jgi:hypothetical protein